MGIFNKTKKRLVTFNMERHFPDLKDSVYLLKAEGFIKSETETQYKIVRRTFWKRYPYSVIEPPINREARDIVQSDFYMRYNGPDLKDFYWVDKDKVEELIIS